MRDRPFRLSEVILLAIALIALLGVFYGVLITGGYRSQQRLNLQIHDCYEQNKRAVMLTNGTIECRD